jgi:uracil-DNA glycosylase
MTEKQVKIEDSWYSQLEDEFSSEYFQKLKQFIVNEKSAHTVYPPGSQIFNAFNFTPFDKVKVVILGQDPYHGPGQAHGLCFSVPAGINPHPRLQIFTKN